MPISKYFKGSGEEVMKGMKKKHGKRAEEVFYRTANKMKMKPHGRKQFTEKHMKAGYMVVSC